MTERTDEQGVVLLRDPAGEYYALPLEVVQRGRLSAGQRAEAERLMAAAAAESGDGNQDDAQGFYLSQHELTIVNLHRLTSMALFLLGDSVGGKTFAGMADGFQSGANLS